MSDRLIVLGGTRLPVGRPGEVVMREYGFTVENVCRKVRALLSPVQP